MKKLVVAVILLAVCLFLVGCCMTFIPGESCVQGCADSATNCTNLCFIGCGGEKNCTVDCSANCAANYEYCAQNCTSLGEFVNTS